MIETKEVKLLGSPNGIAKEYRLKYKEVQGYIKDMQAFGWEPTQTTSRREGRCTYDYQIMARDTSMAHYNDYKQLEEVYKTNKANIKTYIEAEFTTALLLLLVFLIPGIIYIAYKSTQKASIGSHNDYCRLQMQKAVQAARNIK